MIKTMNKKLKRWLEIEIVNQIELEYDVYGVDSLWSFTEMITKLKREFKAENGLIRIYLDLEKWKKEDLPYLSNLYYQQLDDMNKALRDESLGEEV